MADLLRRALAPVTDGAWKEIDTRAAEVLRSQLTARAIVDFDGPHGWQFAAVNLGRLETSDESSPYAIPWGKRLVLPVVEARVPFQLDQLELDNVTRGAKDADLEPLEDAARRLALFEESAVYNGFEPAGIEGIIPSVAHETIHLPDDAREFPEAVARAAQMMISSGIEGPFALVLGIEAWAAVVQSGSRGYPPQRIIRDVIQGDPHMSRAVEGGLLISTAEGNFELTVGQDFSVGYAGSDRDTVELYLTESFTFRVLEPKAGVRLAPA
jgi:uncharacterized linocin/CFP29 family protein